MPAPILAHLVGSILAPLLLAADPLAAPAAPPGREAQPAAAASPAALVAKETPEERDARMRWWRDARFGMFIHWGLYAVAAGEWNGKTVPGAGEWILNTAKIKPEDYEPLLKQFNPVKFDAKKWVAIAKAAGMRYIVITSKHHEGFCLWDTAYTDWDVMSTPFHRDILKELADACQEAGIRLCFYHSIMDWHQPDYLPRRAWDTRPTDQADFNRYRDYMKKQLGELLGGRYGDIGVVWFDGEWESTWNHEFGKDLDTYVRSLKKDIIINNRVDVGRGGMAGMTRDGEYGGDFGTPEQEIPATGFPGVDWETCMTMNGTWGFHKHDQTWKSPETLIRMLCDIASKGGNFLLNVGPTPEGEIPEASVERLAAMGKWLEKNGEAIYDTKASLFASLPFGRSTTKSIEGGTRIYLEVFDWPKDGKLVVPGVLNEVKSARLLADGSALKASSTEGNVVVEIPATAPDPIASVVAIDLVGAPNILGPLQVLPERDQFVDAAQVWVKDVPEGAVVRYTMDGLDPTPASPELKAIAIRRSTTLRARAFVNDKPIGDTVVRKFERLPTWPSVRRDRDPAEVRARVALVDGQFRQVADVKRAIGDSPRYRNLTEGQIGVPAGKNEHFGYYLRGYLRIQLDGLYDFRLTSDDGSVLLIDDKEIVNNDGLHSSATAEGFAPLGRGVHFIEVYYFNREGQADLKVEWRSTGKPWAPLGPGDFVSRD